MILKNDYFTLFDKLLDFSSRERGDHPTKFESDGILEEAKTRQLNVANLQIKFSAWAFPMSNSCVRHKK